MMNRKEQPDGGKRFLPRLAAELISKYGINPEHLKVILPGKRARLFLGRAWAAEAGKPVWAPNVLTMEEFVFDSIGMTAADEMSLVLKLYTVCREHSPEEYSFGQFSGWAPIVLRDFNDVDLFLVDPEQVFMNLLDARELSLWTPGDAQQLSVFEEQYIGFYRNLLPWYRRLREILADDHLAYQGMAFRFLAEHPELISEAKDQTKYVFAGFNAFTRAEEKIINGLISSGRAEIIWDADAWYLDNTMQESGHFMRNWISKHGSADFRFVDDALKNHPKTIHVYGVTGVRGQARLAGELLSESVLNTPDTAIVIPDESLLLPLMNAIPENIQRFNVTMGLSLKHTPALSWLLLNLQLFGRHSGKIGNRFRVVDLLAVIRHPWFDLVGGEKNQATTPAELFFQGSSRYCSVDEVVQACGVYGEAYQRFAEEFFRPADHPADFLEKMEFAVRMLLANPLVAHKPFQQGALVETMRILKVIKEVVTPEMSAEEGYPILRFVLNRLASKASIPFSGEPLEGIQILGLLETRNLDFDHVILLAANEGVLPAGKKHNSLIPADLRRHHGLPGWQYHDAIYAYHFYHLLQRAKRIDILYNSDLSSELTGEMSRFIRQIEAELLPANPGISYTHQQVSDTLEKVEPASAIIIQKSEPVFQTLLYRLETRGLSQSQISNYIKCPLMFFFSFVAGIRESDAYEETVDHRELGILVHEVLKKVYEPVKKEFVDGSFRQGKQALDEEYLRKAIAYAEQMVDDEMKHLLGKGGEISGRNLIINGVAHFMVRSQLVNDLKKLKAGQWSVIDLEKPLEHRMNIHLAADGFMVRFSGFVDRIDFDHSSGRVIIADYKTGQVSKNELLFDQVESLLLDPDKDKAFQLMFYAWLYGHQQNVPHLSAGLIPLKSPSMGFVPLQALENASEVQKEALMMKFEHELVSFCKVLLDRDVPFIQTLETDRCRLCTYQSVCMTGG